MSSTPLPPTFVRFLEAIQASGVQFSDCALGMTRYLQGPLAGSGADKPLSESLSVLGQNARGYVRMSFRPLGARKAFENFPDAPCFEAAEGEPTLTLRQAVEAMEALPQVSFNDTHLRRPSSK